MSEENDVSAREERRRLIELGRLISLQIPETLREGIRYFFEPLHEVGGDFFISFRKPDGTLYLAIGDVAGHDLGSGFVSSYFQGMFTGCLKGGLGIPETLELFNDNLCRTGFREYSDSGIFSLALAVLEISPEEDRLAHWNCGFTPCQVVDHKGFVRELEYGNFPLGWTDRPAFRKQSLRIRTTSFLYLFTDGAVEFAHDLDVNIFSLFFCYFHYPERIKSLKNFPSDDILVLCIPLKLKEVELKNVYEPILSEHYAGTEIDHIDQLQANWRRSLSFALEDRMGDRLYDLLICLREGMINAFVHGCERSAEKFAHLQIAVSPDKDALRVVIDDPGRGHKFKAPEGTSETTSEIGRQLGLGIISHLSDDYAVDNRGTSLIFEFAISPDPDN